MLNSRRCLLSAFALISAITNVVTNANPAKAIIVGVDFGQSASTSPTNWTLITGSGTTNNLIDETGSVTAVDITVSSPASNFNANVSSNTIPINSNPIDNISGNIFNIGTDSLTITLSDLVANQTYDYSLFGLRDGVDGTDQDVQVNGVNFNQTATSQNLIINSTVGNDTSTLSSFAIPITANSSGEIITTVTGNNGLYAVAGIAVEDTASVPFEFSPTTGLVLSLGLFGLHYKKRNNVKNNLD